MREVSADSVTYDAVHRLVHRSAMSILGPTQRPVAQISSRRHPLAFALYTTVFIMGVIFVTHWFGVHKTQDALFPHIPAWVIFLWKWEMVTGGAAAMVALIAKPRTNAGWPDLADLLHFEAIGALVCAFGLGTYAAAIEGLVGWDQAAPSLALYCVLVAGLVWRGVQAFREAKRLEQLAEALHKAGEEVSDVRAQ